MHKDLKSTVSIGDAHEFELKNLDGRISRE